MADNVRLLALRRNLTNAELMGDDERVKRIKGRIANLEKAESKAPPAPAGAVTTTTTVTKTVAKKAPKKATKSRKK
jgi:hypothetical protein